MPCCFTERYSAGTQHKQGGTATLGCLLGWFAIMQLLIGRHNRAAICSLLSQGYRPSDVPQEIVEEIALIVEAKAYSHVVSRLICTYQHSLTVMPASVCTNRAIGCRNGRECCCISM